MPAIRNPSRSKPGRKTDKQGDVCPICGLRVASRLQRHVDTHNDELPYHCTWPGCQKGDRQESNLKTHYKSVHLKLRIPCTDTIIDKDGQEIPCPEDFAQPSCLRRHRQRKHNGSIEKRTTATGKRTTATRKRNGAIKQRTTVTKARITAPETLADDVWGGISPVYMPQPTPRDDQVDPLYLLNADAPIAGPSGCAPPKQGDNADDVAFAPAANVAYQPLDLFGDASYWSPIDPLLTNGGQQLNPLLEASMHNYLYQTIGFAQSVAPCSGFDLATTILQSQASLYSSYISTPGSSPTSSLSTPSPSLFFAAQGHAQEHDFHYPAPDLPHLGHI